jgi:hypothetical protein
MYIVRANITVHSNVHGTSNPMIKSESYQLFIKECWQRGKKENRKKDSVLIDMIVW